MNNYIIKLLNLEQFNLKIDKLETIKTNNVLYCYITIINQSDRIKPWNYEQFHFSFQVR